MAERLVVLEPDPGVEQPPVVSEVVDLVGVREHHPMEWDPKIGERLHLPHTPFAALTVGDDRRSGGGALPAAASNCPARGVGRLAERRHLDHPAPVLGPVGTDGEIGDET